MAERNVKVDHSTLNRWVIEYAPKFETEFRKSHKQSVNTSWRMDETYLKVKGEDVYLYRAVDKLGKTIDFKLTKKRDKKSALSFFTKAIGQHGLPEKVTMDKSGANKSAIDYVNSFLVLLSIIMNKPLQILVRQIKYLNNIVEADHRFIKKLTKPMLSFKAFYSAEATIAGIKLHHMLKKGQRRIINNTPVFEPFYALAGVVSGANSSRFFQKDATEPTFASVILLSLTWKMIKCQKIQSKNF